MGVARLTSKDGFVGHTAFFVMNVGSNEQSQEVFAGGAFGASRFLLDEDTLPVLNDFHAHLVHNGFSTVANNVSSKRLNTISVRILNRV